MSQPRLRDAARAVVLDPDGRVLLVRLKRSRDGVASGSDPWGQTPTADLLGSALDR